VSGLQAIRWDGALHLLDQRVLPHHAQWLRLEHPDDVAHAITDMVVRGAPAIAITAAYGMALAHARGVDRQRAHDALLAARPTAVNLRWALERLERVPGPELEAAACAIHAQDVRDNRALGDCGADVLPAGGVLTICNTGALATGGWGTALGVCRSMRQRGKAVHVWALETRPYLQGARLTAYECVHEGLPCTLVTDGMAAAVLARGAVASVVVGCDRVAANGDTANKIGTLQLAVLARHYGVPFYVAMPWATLDPRCGTGAGIPIEERGGDEVRGVFGHAVAPARVQVWNPAFDVTPAALISGWFTERGLWSPSRAANAGLP
jgi:methylthioribose-1-phosphate isomerase